MPASIGYLVIDTTDPQRLTPFWCRLMDVNVDTTTGDGQFLVLSPTKTASPSATTCAASSRRQGHTDRSQPPAVGCTGRRTYSAGRSHGRPAQRHLP
jgi:hypothetical protein